MTLRALSFVLACMYAMPAAAAERPGVPLTRTNIVTREVPAVRESPAAARPMIEFRAAPSDLPRANFVRPDGATMRPVLPRGDVRPIEPNDARPIMPMLPGRPELRPDTGAPPVDLPRPLPMPIEGRPITLPARPAN
jgi:hypothetical protein